MELAILLIIAQELFLEVIDILTLASPTVQNSVTFRLLYFQSF